jgi:hypothetical protein
MPILRISSRITPCAALTSIRRSGPAPFVGSEPRKKLRQIDISGTVARSWKTVAIPCERASRGEPNLVSTPSTSNSPSSCWCTPERILMNVDLPAPLSPSTQVTWPAQTAADTSLIATTLPKYFETLRTSSSGVPFPVALTFVPPPRCGARGC